MEHIAAIMILVGCTQGNVDCREVPSPTVGFETVEECRAYLSPSVDAVRNTFKVSYGKCAAVDPAVFMEDATISWAITDRDELTVDITVDDGTTPVMAEAKGARPRVLSN